MDIPWKSLTGYGLFTVAAMVISYRRLATQEDLRVQRKKNKQNNKVNIGAIFGMDIGGTLTKIVYFQTADANSGGKKTPIKRDSSDSLALLDDPDHIAALDKLYSYLDASTALKNSAILTRDDVLSLYSAVLEGRLHFLHFETRNMVQAISFLNSNTLTDNITSIGCTGGGAHKYAADFQKELEITFNKFDEMGCLVRGVNFALTNFKDECYTFRNAPEVPGAEIPVAVKRWQTDVKEYSCKVTLPYEAQSAFPFLLVNIGSGVSILKVSSPSQYERVSGSSVGGGTYWGLCRLLTKCATFEEVLDLAENGDAGKVDMLVRDIYGGDYAGLLTGALIAADFGKLVMKESPLEGVKEEDLALALLMMVTNNLSQVAYLNAKLHNCNKIYFVGSFLRHNSISCRRLAFAIDFWSGSKMEALFLAHEGYFGALGTFLQSAFGDDVDKLLCTKKYMGEQVRNKQSASGKSSASSRAAGLELKTDSNDQPGELEDPSPLTKYIAEQFSQFRWRSKSFNDGDEADAAAAAASAPADITPEDVQYKRKNRSSSDDYVVRASRSSK